ncbi:cytochrome ubiquinol oxidase subunit I [Desulfovibrio sp. TomC]|uniref:cytochrome ubiquinol oxidase subunit I n=1 Tax=Desulfovibrio sp. TomC TaxID=1562888 RepID=UPI0005750DFA|nr:cytochrome ubiquinol oxidase subunit I [Desulfovibrio sp. TomC]KHK01178.1 Cytochrome d ubiquinol oxidase subunit I [Desulfovibrio sp. TomC]
MDTLMLSRLQFAFATFIHFIFVPLTLGLSVLIAIMETKYVRTGDETYKRMAKFWGKLFLINFALGIVTGITLEFQFGTNWSRYSAFVGDIFGSLLAIEATAAFFLESTFLGVWIFGWNKLSPKVHLLAIWLVAIAANFSALWIILANGFMQHPVGYVIQNGRAELGSFIDVITNGYGWNAFLHTVTGAWALAGFFVVGVSAWHLLRKQNIDFFTKSFRIGAGFALIFSLLVAVVGHRQGNIVAEVQPAKLAAMESHWDTQKNAPMYLFALPDPDNEKNSIEIGRIPSILSLMAFNDPSASVKGLKDFPKEDRPPVALTFSAFRVMVGLGTAMIVLAILAFIARHQPVESSPRLLKLLIWGIPLPYLCLQAGWAVAEVGRQPWIVYGIMRTKDAVSPIATSQVAISLAAFFVVYILLAALDIFLLAKYARSQPH